MVADSAIYQFDAGLVSVTLGVLMIAAAALGARVAHQRGRAGKETAQTNLSAIETGLFGLLGLLLAFTFSGAASRFDNRAALLIDAANAMHGAILRTDLYPAAERDTLRKDLRQYLELQISFYNQESDPHSLGMLIQQSDAIQQQLWAKVSNWSRDPANSLASVQMLNALDKVFALTASRQIASQAHMPAAIVWLLFVMAIATAYTSGYTHGASGKFSWAGYIGFSLLTAMVIYVTLDLDSPGRGIIRRDVQEQSFIALRPFLTAQSVANP
ncbi:hypothetical protein [Silvimonas soli]|uniref:bestrophin-like domain n=1 Tax=Silvimonas soli TaxID=2980100 RepID=UPI0024B3C788|nr:hypothetical protein [Silvimonas soli]